MIDFATLTLPATLVEDVVGSAGALFTKLFPIIVLPLAVIFCAGLIGLVIWLFTRAKAAVPAGRR